MDKDIFIVYCSPNGSTRHVAKRIGNQLDHQNIAFTETSLDSTLDWNPTLEQIKTAGDNCLILIGSPVYKGLAVEPVMNFIRNPPEVKQGSCLPFVTWGSISSGIALWQMGRELVGKGYKIAAAAKVLSRHSAMWSADSYAYIEKRLKALHEEPVTKVYINA